MASIERRTRRSLVVALASGLLAMAGCSESPETVTGPEAPVVENTPAVAETPVAVEPPAASTESTPADENASAESGNEEAPLTPTQADAETPPPTVAEYTAPFPDRVDLFVPPKRQGGARLEGGTEDEVKLLGFIRVDRQRAVLSINGQITPIEAGASLDGVEVISIHPRSVVLQRGRQRWQASLEN